jgi:hypothetical protein
MAGRPSVSVEVALLPPTTIKRFMYSSILHAVPTQALHNLLIVPLRRVCRSTSVLLPAFQVQVLICTGNSGSDPERAPCRQIVLVVNDLIRNTVRGVKAVMALRNLSLGETFVSCLAGRSFATECFFVECAEVHRYCFRHFRFKS